jgi:hypothetical protein
MQARRKRARLVGAVVSLGLLLLISVAAGNTTYRYSGHMCVHVTDFAHAEYFMEHEGPFNENPDYGQSWICPAGGWQASSVDLVNAEIRVQDETTVGAIGCNVNLITGNGTSMSTPVRYSCPDNGGTGGCLPALTPADRAFEGIGTLTFSNPFSSQSNVQSYFFECSLPELEDDASDRTPSYLMGYRFEQVNP